MMLSPELDTLLKEQFLGKRIEVKMPATPTQAAYNVVGMCTFIGNNEYFPSFGLQVTVDRLPIKNVEVQNISLV